METLPGRLRNRLFGLARGVLPFAVLTVFGAPGADSVPPEDTSIAVEPGVSRALARGRARRVADLSYELHLSIPEAVDAPLRGRVLATFDLRSTAGPLQFDFAATPAQVLAVLGEGEPLPYEFQSEHLVIPGSALRAGRNHVEIAFRAPQDAVNRNPDFLFTLFVPDRARTAFPLFDQPDLKARFTLYLETPAEWQALSNAGVESRREIGGARENEGRLAFRFGRTELIPSYLFSFVAGRFETVTRSIGGRTMTLLHRETDRGNLARNLDTLFALHTDALQWLEDYTAIPYPFSKFDFALIPDFPYSGMEHVGAIQYRASSLLLDESPSATQRLDRAQLIAHETAHMWFGDLVTMRWFDDVWTKEVFANFMADKIVNSAFVDIDHELRFLVSHYPQAYGVDRSEGANPIRQSLGNLNQAGELYGPVIYHKAPIMMRQLERLIGERALRDGLRRYLRDFAYGNADWPALITILDGAGDRDLRRWSDVWVNSTGRPEFILEKESAGALPVLRQRDPRGLRREWPQRFEIRRLPDGGHFLNADGMGYGLFPSQADVFSRWSDLSSVERGVLLINENENLLEGRGPGPASYFARLRGVLGRESDPLLLDVAARQLRYLYLSLLSDAERGATAQALEAEIWSTMLAQRDPAGVKRFYELYLALATTPQSLQRLEAVWDGSDPIDRLSLGEPERVTLAETLAVRLPHRADDIIAKQLAQTENADRKRRLTFMAPALSADQATRDAFFRSLHTARNRRSEVWVTDALRRLHDPTRRQQSEKYLQPTLELLEEVQRTGDIFFPSVWLESSLGNHVSDRAVAVVRDFLNERENYPAQLRMKILQAADPLFRANRLRLKTKLTGIGEANECINHGSC